MNLGGEELPHAPGQVGAVPLLNTLSYLYDTSIVTYVVLYHTTKYSIQASQNLYGLSYNCLAIV